MRGHKRSVSVAELIRREIADIIQNRVKNPHVGFLAVTDVALSDDLKHANIYISVLKKNEAETTIKALHSSAGFIKGELGHRVKLRYMPDIHFRIDEAIEYGSKMDGVLREVMAKEGAGHENT
ncbi:MAG: 30S ribosome-binding factor RbfA [Nitrospirae bacterium]|nr:30S ribosome-binding factor RbfA [Nitrospirota bacterium]